MARMLLTPKEAAAAMGVSINHVRRLIDEADSMGKRARWRHGKEIIDSLLSTQSDERCASA